MKKGGPRVEKIRSRIARRHLEDSSSSADTWAELRALAGKCHLNLGQGFPDFIALPQALDAAKESIYESVENNQYGPMGGIQPLKEALANMYSRRSHVCVDTTHISITTSGTEAIYCAMQALVNPGDRVLVFEPCFPWYTHSIKQAGGIMTPVELYPPQFSLLDSRVQQQIAAVFNDGADRTPTVMILCNPGNPTGHVLSEQELAFAANLVIQHNMVCVSDEVYEAVIFPSERDCFCPRAREILDRLEILHSHHVSMRSVDRMAAQTLSIGSASKLLSLTGWRVGWVVGPPDIVKAVRASSGYSTYCAPTPLQHACSKILNDANSSNDFSFGGVGSIFASNWLRLAVALEENIPGARVCSSQGGYFLCLDISGILGMDDLSFVQRLVDKCGIAALPLRLFYSDSSIPRQLVRFAVCKKSETITDAILALQQWSN